MIRPIFTALALTLALSATGLAQFPEPAPEHKIVMQDVGEWDAVVKLWMNEQGTADESVEPMVSKGTEVNRKLGEFWCISTFKGEFAGMPFEGHSVSGFDPIKKKFVGSWTDTFSPNAMHMIGTYDEKTKTLTSQTKGIGMDGKEVIGKSTLVYKDAKTRLFTTYEMVDGKPVKSMEITYTRTK